MCILPLRLVDDSLEKSMKLEVKLSKVRVAQKIQACIALLETEVQAELEDLYISLSKLGTQR